MSTELLINVTPQETRVAQVENGILHELLIERAEAHGLVGNIYKGTVKRVLPGMQAAFIEVGLERSAFLHVSDMVSLAPGETLPAVREVLREGQDVLVQVIKDPMGTKGARLTTLLSIASRYLVYMPKAKRYGDDENLQAGVSLRIDDEVERTRLKQMLTEIVPASQPGVFIVRTAGQHMDVDALEADCKFLIKLWALIQERSKQVASAELVHGDLPLVLRAFRDLLTPNVSRVTIDSLESYQQVEGFLSTFMPHLRDTIDYYSDPQPLFDLYNVEDEIVKALERRVNLKSGGYLVFDQTESMTTIDVNTGGFVGHRNLEDTIFKTNLEAAQALARQLRLRNLGGIVIIDFIDMESESHRERVLQALLEALENDHARTNVSEVSSLGLVEMTRQRTRESLEHILCEECPTCNGKGSVRSAETITFEIYREIVRSARQFNTGQPMVIAAEGVINHLLDTQTDAMAELEDVIGMPIRLQAETGYPPDQYDVVLV